MRRAPLDLLRDDDVLDARRALVLADGSLLLRAYVGELDDPVVLVLPPDADRFDLLEPATLRDAPPGSAPPVFREPRVVMARPTGGFAVAADLRTVVLHDLDDLRRGDVDVTALQVDPATLPEPGEHTAPRRGPAGRARRVTAAAPAARHVHPGDEGPRHARRRRGGGPGLLGHPLRARPGTGRDRAACGGSDPHDG